MSRLLRKPGRSFFRPPPFVFGVVAVEVVAAIVLLFLGVAFSDLLKSAAPAITVTIVLLTPIVQELGRRQPSCPSSLNRRATTAS
jgi:hypothetical protein